MIDAPEATELPFDAVEVAMVVRVGCREVSVAPAIGDRDLGHALNRKRQPRDPRLAGHQVLQVIAGRRRVLDVRSKTQIVSEAGEQMRLLAAHQIHVFHRADRVAGRRRGPNQTGGSIAQQIHDRGGSELMGERKSWQREGG